MSKSVAGRNAAAAGLAAAGTWISLHTADPATTGANEVVGSTRGQTTWGAPGGGSVVGSAATIAVPASAACTHYGVWNASTGGTFLVGGALPVPETFGAAGNYSATPTVNG